MIDKERIKAEAEAFFEWPSKDKAYVTTTSMLIFAATIAEMARTEEREACAQVCESEEARVDALHDNIGGESLYLGGKGVAASKCARLIRERSNAQVRGCPPHEPEKE